MGRISTGPRVDLPRAGRAGTDPGTPKGSPPSADHLPGVNAAACRRSRPGIRRRACTAPAMGAEAPEPEEPNPAAAERDEAAPGAVPSPCEPMPGPYPGIVELDLSAVAADGGVVAGPVEPSRPAATDTAEAADDPPPPAGEEGPDATAAAVIADPGGVGAAGADADRAAAGGWIGAAGTVAAC